MKVLVFNGAPESGKGSVAQFIKMNFCVKLEEYSSIDYVKQVAEEQFGWDKVKDVKGRNLLADIKQLMINYNDLPTKKVIEKIHEANQNGVDVLIVDIREPDEIEKLVNFCSDAVFAIECYTCRIKNESAEEEARLEKLRLKGDRLYGKYEYDITILNEKTLEDLEKEVIEKFKSILKPARAIPLKSVDEYIKNNGCVRCGKGGKLRYSNKTNLSECHHCGQQYIPKNFEKKGTTMIKKLVKSEHHRGHMVPLSVVLSDLASQEGCDGEPYDQMMMASEYIDELEATVSEYMETITKINLKLDKMLKDTECKR